MPTTAAGTVKTAVVEHSRGRVLPGACWRTTSALLGRLARVQRQPHLASTSLAQRLLTAACVKRRCSHPSSLHQPRHSASSRPLEWWHGAVRSARPWYSAIRGHRSAGGDCPAAVAAFTRSRGEQPATSPSAIAEMMRGSMPLASSSAMHAWRQYGPETLAYLPTSPHISPHLPTSPRISPHLHISSPRVHDAGADLGQSRPISAAHLGSARLTLAVPRLYLGCTSALPRLYLGCTSGA